MNISGGDSDPSEVINLPSQASTQPANEDQVIESEVSYNSDSLLNCNRRFF